MGRAAPLAAQIHHRAIGQGAAHHAPAHPLASLEHPHHQPAGLQAPCRDQSRQPGSDDQHIEHCRHQRGR